MPNPERPRIGRYELHERLGVGGMGTVWHAWDPALQRDVAVKEVLLPDGMSEEDRAEAHARTLREAQATARISHTAVVTIHDVLEHGASPWIVMELLSGASLQHHTDTHGPLPVDQVERAARALLGGLRAAHAVGVTHRDVKPANIMLTEDDRTVLTDFGIANVDGSAALTQTGVYIGSPEYMAPERFEGERALPASDLWSLGVTLYSLLEGRSPFKRDSITGMISAVLTAPVPPTLTVNEAADSPRSAALRALIAALLTREVSKRPDPAQALELLERERQSALKDVHTHKAAVSKPPPPSPSPSALSSLAPPRSSPVASAPPTLPAAPIPPASSSPAPGPPQRGNTPAQGRPAPQRQLHPPRSRPPGLRPPQPRPVQPRPVPTDAAQRFVEGIEPTGLNPAPSSPSPPPSHPNPSSPPPAAERPSGVLTAMVMLGINALVLLVLTLIGIASAADSAAPGWGGVVLSGLWGALSMVGALGLLSRSRLVFALVVFVQGVAAVFLALRMFTVLIYTPELLVIHALMLLYTLTIGGLLLLPATSRAYFGLG